jgi:hypothetical protein
VAELVQAIHAANASPGTDILDLEAGCVYNLTEVDNAGPYGDTGLPLIDTYVVINGNGATIQRSQASGTPNFRLLLVEQPGQLVLRELKLRNGLASDASQTLPANVGGAAVNRGVLIIESSLVEENIARFSGGAIMNFNELRVKKSTFTRNDLSEFQITGKGAAIYNTVESASAPTPPGSLIERSTFVRNGLNFGREALFNAYGPMTVSNSTISSNGAGIDNEEDLSLSFSTVVNNQYFGVYSYQAVELKNSIIASNGEKDCGGAYSNWAVLGAAMDTDGTCPGAYTVTPGQLALAPLADNGGFTRTHALNEGSFAINLAAGTCPSIDQRGEPRPVGAYCDLGAYESPYDPEIVVIPGLPQQPTATPQLPDAVLIAVPIQNANCREGNGNQFEIADTLFEGQAYVPDGRGRDRLWLRFLGPVTGVHCWAFIDNLDLLLNGDTIDINQISEDLLPIVPYPPTPTPSPTPTFTPEPSETPAPSQTECSDGIDNDSDRYVDMQDPQCRNQQDNSESKP